MASSRPWPLDDEDRPSGSVRPISPADLQAILAHLGSDPDELLAGTDADRPVVAVRVRASVGRPGGSAQAQWRQLRATEWTAWTRTLPWRVAVILGIGAAGGVLGSLLAPRPPRHRPDRPGAHEGHRGRWGDAPYLPRPKVRYARSRRHPAVHAPSRHLLSCATTQTKEAMEMPKVSRDSAPQRQDAGPVVDLRGELDGYTVSFTSLLEDIDATPLLKGLPDDRCQCPHWGYVLKGKMTARYADRDEVFEVGDAFYTPPGHVPVKNEPGTEILWFSPSEELRTAEAVMLKNMQAMQDGSTP